VKLDEAQGRHYEREAGPPYAPGKRQDKSEVLDEAANAENYCQRGQRQKQEPSSGHLLDRLVVATNSFENEDVDDVPQDIEAKRERERHGKNVLRVGA
jgi:hypothetical protein